MQEIENCLILSAILDFKKQLTGDIRYQLTAQSNLAPHTSHGMVQGTLTSSCGLSQPSHAQNEWLLFSFSYRNYIYWGRGGAYSEAIHLEKLCYLMD